MSESCFYGLSNEVTTFPQISARAYLPFLNDASLAHDHHLIKSADLILIFLSIEMTQNDCRNLTRDYL
ncbi:hypothetical protein ABKN59_002262 [Abortiporus biennis]